MKIKNTFQLKELPRQTLRKTVVELKREVK